jgi:putative PIN family toxin of toxin-antitoxin system
VATLRVLLDTNVLLSGIAYPSSVPGKILAAWRHGSLEVLLSDYILDELRRVLPRLVHRHGLTENEMEDLVDVLAIQTELIDLAATPVPTDERLRDAADQPVLAALRAGQASGRLDYLITGDKDLLVLAEHYPIVTPAAFWSAHGGL